MKYVEIAGRRYLWREVLHLRREQRKAQRQESQPSLFPLHEDRRPEAERSASDRYQHPSLFEGGRNADR